VSVFEPKTKRTTGYAHFYLGNPWGEPANVTVNTLRMFDRQEIRWMGKNKSNETYGAVMTAEPIPSWAFQETAILAEVLLVNGYNLTNMKNKVVCSNRTHDTHFKLATVPDSYFQARCFDGYLDTLHLHNLKTLPESFGKLKNLLLVSISGQLKELPSTIGNLTKLQTLSVRNNQLSSLPSWIGNLTKLQGLDVSLNQLSVLPSWIGNLTKLQKLSVANNQLTSLTIYDWKPA
jgi:Leucine-rich repeat (LRR) protein